MLVIKIFTKIALFCLNFALGLEHSCLSFLNKSLIINVGNASEVYYGLIRVIRNGTISAKLEGLRLDSSKNLVVEQPTNFLNETFHWSGKTAKILFCRGTYYVCYDLSEEEFRNKSTICAQSTTSPEPQDSRQWCFLLLIVPVIIIILAVIVLKKKKCNNKAKGSGMDKLNVNDHSKCGDDQMHLNNNNY